MLLVLLPLALFATAVICAVAVWAAGLIAGVDVGFNLRYGAAAMLLLALAKSEIRSAIRNRP